MMFQPLGLCSRLGDETQFGGELTTAALGSQSGTEDLQTSTDLHQLDRVGP